MRKLIKILSLTLLFNLTNIYAHSDSYIEGYLSSLFRNNYDIDEAFFEYKDGLIILDKNKTAGHNPDMLRSKILNSTKQLKDIKDVVWKDEVKNYHIKKKLVANKSVVENMQIPYGSLFSPLIADPKWPRFTLAYQYFSHNQYTRHAFAPNFGASFGLLKYTADDNSYAWEVGVQAGLFAIMDIGSKQSALINADYYVGLPLTFSNGKFEQIYKIYHLSAHLGDEFMLTKQGKKVDRVNLSYEGIDILYSYNWGNFRLYGGGGYLINVDPSYVKRGKIQTGMEYYSPNTYFNGSLRPVSAIDIKFNENNKWRAQISVKTGVQLENAFNFSKKIMLMLEYYKGNFFHGQFYKKDAEYIGIGLHSFI